MISIPVEGKCTLQEATMALRFIVRDGKRILQQKWMISEWTDGFVNGYPREEW